MFRVGTGGCGLVSVFKEGKLTRLEDYDAAMVVNFALAKPIITPMGRFRGFFIEKGVLKQKHSVTGSFVLALCHTEGGRYD